jgi:predicted transcriptional regulator
MLSLLNGEKKLAGLKEDIDAQATTILHTLNDLEDMGITTKFHGVYRLTSLGIIEAQVCKEHTRTLGVIEKHKNFWLTHDTSAIPTFLMTNIGVLEKSVIIRASSTNLQEVHENFMGLLGNSKVIYGVSPIFHPEYIEVFGEVLNQGSKVCLIVNPAILEKMKHGADELLSKHVAEGNLQIFVNDNIRVALTITEKYLSLGLFNLLGEYDYSNDLICDSKESLDWGHQLFKSILEQSIKVQ